MIVRRWIAVVALAAGVVLGGACTDKDEPSGSSENRGEDLQTPTSGVTPPGNPESGETGTDGQDTGSR